MMRPVADYVEAQKIRINEAIQQYQPHLFSSERMHEQAALFTLYPEGHRYRSILGLEVYSALGGHQDAFLKGVVGLECIHHASLIFDDLPCMDNAKERKAKPTTWVKYGEATAILAAVTLENEGRHLIAENAREHSVADSAQEDLVYKILSEVYAGQELDLRGEKSEKELLEAMKKKNSLMKVACLLPGVFLQRSDVYEILETVGEDLAFAYQLFDDLRDTVSPKITGKPARQDEQKQTLLYRWGEQRVRNELKQRKEACVRNIREVNGGTMLEYMIEYMLTIPS